jgi:DNA-binding response OmpR family regulator
LAILDLQTPDKEDWAVLESVTRLAPVMPVVALTMWSNQQERANGGGIDALLEKPLDLLLLLDTIRELLAQSETRGATHSAEALC